MSINWKRCSAYLIVWSLSAAGWAGSAWGAGARWTELGPDGGRVPVIVVDPNERDTVYAFTNAGLYKSTDGARSWRPLPLPGSSAGSRSRLVVTPSDSSALFALSSAGVHRSVDGGATWAFASQGVPRFSENDLALDAADGRLYVSTGSSGVYFSDDKGTTWTRMEAETARRGGGLIFVHPLQPARLIITVFSGPAPGTYISVNRGVDWTRVSPLLLERIYFHAGSPDRLFAFATRGENDNSDRVLRSLNRGQTWEAIHTDSRSASFWLGLLLDSSSGTPRFASTSSGLLGSTDGGVNWTDISRPPADGGTLALAGDGRVPQALYVGSALRGVLKSDNLGNDWRESAFRQTAFNPTQLEVDPAGVLYALSGLNENSLRKSSNGGATWEELSGYSQPLGSMAIDPANANTLYLVTQQQFVSAILWRSQNGGATWARRGDLIPEIAGQSSTQWVTQLVVDPVDSMRMFAAAFGAVNSEPPERSGVHKSTNGGQTWRRVLVAGDLFTVVLDPSDASVVYAGSGANIVGDGVYKSTDGGENWTRRNQGLSDTAIQNLALDPRNPQHLYARTLGGVMFRTTDGAANWSPYQAAGRAVREIAFHPTQNLTYVITSDGEVLRSRNGGTSWQSIGFPGSGARDLRFDRSDPRAVLALTNRGAVRFPSPLWLFAAGDPERSGTRFDGVAVSNSTEFTAGLDFATFEGLAPADLPADAPSATAHVDLSARRQLARLRSQLFPGDNSAATWIELIGDTQVSTFFQYGSNDLRQLDGGVAAEIPYRRLIFRQVFDGPMAYRGQRASTRLSLFNPNRIAVSVRLRYHFPGTAAAGLAAAFDPVVRQIPARSTLVEAAGQLFPGVLQGGWVEAETEEGHGLVGFAVVEFPDARTQLGFNAIGDATSRNLASAQFATAPGSLFTDLNLINIGLSPRRVTLTAIQGNGGQLAPPLVFDMQPGESITREAGELFSGAFVASLKVEVNGEGVIGGVVFGDPARLRYAAALNLQPQPFREAVFSQVASVPGTFFTGLAFFYPETDPAAPPAEIQIQVVRADGTLTGQVTRTLQPGQRISPLVEELVMAARGQAGGYVYFLSSRPVISQMLFGSLRAGAIQLFSAVPASGL